MKLAERRENFISLSIFICFLWSGMILGISFLEAPLKFQAPGITLGLGLGIGRLVFSALNKIELVFLTGLIFAWIITPSTKKTTALLTVIFIILLSQTFWLLPLLDERAGFIINNKTLPQGNSPHIFYVLAELIKLICLVTLGFRYLQKRDFK